MTQQAPLLHIVSLGWLWVFPRDLLTGSTSQDVTGQLGFCRQQVGLAVSFCRHVAAQHWETTSQHDNGDFLPLSLYDTLMYNENVTYHGSSGVIKRHAVAQHVFTWRRLHESGMEMRNVALMIPGGFVTLAVSRPQNTESPGVHVHVVRARALTSPAW